MPSYLPGVIFLIIGPGGAGKECHHESTYRRDSGD